MNKHSRPPLEIVYRHVTDLVANPHNARTHSPKQIRQLEASIQEFGFVNPVIIDRKNKIMAGHGRLLAAKKIGIDKVPTIVLEDLTEDQIRAYIVADNRLAEKAGWDKSILAILGCFTALPIFLLGLRELAPLRFAHRTAIATSVAGWCHAPDSTGNLFNKLVALFFSVPDCCVQLFPL